MTKIDKEKGEITFTKGGGGFGKGEGRADDDEVRRQGQVHQGQGLVRGRQGRLRSDGDYPDGAAGLAKAVEEAAKKAEENKDKDKGRARQGKFGAEPGVGVRIVTEGEGDSAKITEIKVVTFQKKKADAE